MASFFFWRSRREEEREVDALAWLDDAEREGKDAAGPSSSERYVPAPPPSEEVEPPADEPALPTEEDASEDEPAPVPTSVVATTEVPIKSRVTGELARRRIERESLPVVGESGQPTILQRDLESAEPTGSAPTAGLGSAAKPEVVDSDATYQPKEKEYMSQIDTFVSEMLDIEGATGAAIVDISSGMALATGGHPGFDLNVAAAGNSNVVRAKLATMNDIGAAGRIEDFMITLSDQYHLLSVLSSSETEGLFIYLVLDRKRANLALARHKVNQIAKKVSV